MGTRPSPSRSFVSWIERIIADPKAGYCLPTIAELSGRFGISRSSVRRKLRPFIDDGRLTAVQGRGIFVSSRMPEAPRPSVLPTATSPHSVADAVSEDIAAGKLKHGDPLPEVKLLSGRFKTTTATVTSAYRLLQERGLARRIGRRYWIGGMRSIQSFGVRKKIPCFNFSVGDPSDLAAGNEIGNAWENMELELHNHGLSLHLEDSRKLDLFLRPDAFARSDCAGLLISGIEYNQAARIWPRLETLCASPARGGRRILLCGSDPELRIPTGAHFFCHGTIITNVVRTAAEYAFTKGFRTIVFLFRETEDNASDIRFFLRFISESLLRNPVIRITFLIQPLHRNQALEQIFKRMSSYRLLGSFQYQESLLSKYAPFTMDELFKTITLCEDIDDLLSRAPRDALWLTQDAAVAVRAVEWCAAHRIRLPSDVSLLCFDRDPSLRHHGIASCVPDWNTMGYLMAHALIGDMPIQTSRRGFLRTPAVLYERSTIP